MNYILAPLVLGAAAATANAMELSPDTHVSLGSCLAVGVAVVGGAFWVGRYMQKVDDRLTAIERVIHPKENNDE
jgi:hypothetical protein